ncbi:MAG: hypothetical protein A2297_06240 [Elusimicrobia bacterium RIFOXYB2_FULL_48_7]|nr:MAG: hypothetical protein A2297_06240 [Elusimicrobia bacterium RIFOXYB2_FULL_48_7]
MFQSIKKTILSVSVLFVLIASISLIFLKGGNIFTGIFAGIAISLLNTYLLAVTLEQISSLENPKVWSYFWRTAFLRLPAVILVFCVLIVFLKINLVGFFAGLTAGFIIGIIQLTKIAKQAKPCQLSPKA